MESKVLRPMTIGWPIVVRLKNAKSSGRCHGIALRRADDPVAADGDDEGDPGHTAMGALIDGCAS